MRRIVVVLLFLVPAAAASAAGDPADAPRTVTYVPSIVSVPSDAHWGETVAYVVDVRSHSTQVTTVPVGLLVYLSDPAGSRLTKIGLTHRMLRVPAHGVVSFRFRTTAPSRPTNRQLCLGVTVAGDSSGAFVCSDVT
jgi:hypothetical protein